VDVTRFSRPRRPPRSKFTGSGSKVGGTELKGDERNELKSMWATVWRVCLARTEYLHQLLQQLVSPVSFLRSLSLSFFFSVFESLCFFAISSSPSSAPHSDEGCSVVQTQGPQ